MGAYESEKEIKYQTYHLIPVFILGIFSIISNVMSVSNIRNVNRSAVQISEVSLKNVSGLAEIQKQTQDIHNLGLSHIIAVDLDSMIKLVEKSAVRKMHWRKIWKVTRHT